METNNNYFITNMVERIVKGESSLFLNQSELKRVISKLNKKQIKYEIFYPYDGAEKTVVYTETKPDVILIEIKSKKELKHSDILGSLFGNNINPNNYGDIIIMNNKYYLPILGKLSKFFLHQFNQIGNVFIEVEEVDFDVVEEYEIEYDQIKILCSSLRLDNIVSSVTNLSRNSVDKLFDDDNILLNYENVKKFKTLELGDIISIRRYGKYKFNQIIGQNKKNKMIVEMLKYK